jgi:predicted PurR-regulated permease PerM
VTHALGGLFGGVTTFFLIVILGIYFALEPDIYRRGLAWMFPLDTRPHLKVTLQRMGKALRMLLFGRMIGMVTEGVATWILLAVYGVPMSALLGIMTGLLVFLPNIGAPLSGLMMVLVGFSGGTDMGIYCIIVYLVVQTVDGNVIVPMVAKKTADLAPALVLGAQLIFGVLFGILGLALADPIVAMIKIALERQAERNGSRAPATRRTKPSPATNCLTANFPALHEPQRSDHAMSAKRVIQAAVLFVFLAGLWFAVITLFPVQLSRMAFAPTHGFEPLPR